MLSFHTIKHTNLASKLLKEDYIYANQITGKECFQILNVLAIFNFAPKRCSPFSFFLLPYIYLKKYPKLLLKNMLLLYQYTGPDKMRTKVVLSNKIASAEKICVHNGKYICINNKICKYCASS